MRFGSAVKTLAGATALSQGIVVVSSPILSRLYTPEHFGLLAAFAAILGLVGSIASLRYNLAIPLPKSPRDGVAVTVLALLATLLVAAIFAATTWPFATQIANLVNMPTLAEYHWMLPLGMFLSGLYVTLSAYGLRAQLYGRIARTRLTQSGIMIAIQILGAGFGPVALIVGRVVGQAVGIGNLALALVKRDCAALRSLRRADLIRNAVTYRKFPLVSSWAGLASSIGANLPSLLIAAFLGPAEAGLFALTHRVLSLPMGVIGKAVGDVFYRNAARANDEPGGIAPIIEIVHARMTGAAMAPALVIATIAPEAFGLIFGEEWIQAGTLAAIMMPWMLMQITVTPPTRVFPILDRHDLALRFQLFFVAAAVVSLVIGGLVYKDLVISVAILSALNTLVYAVRLLTAFKLVGVDRRLALHHMISPLLIALLATFPLFAAIALSATPGILIAAAVTSSILALVVTIIVLKRPNCRKTS